MKLGIEEAGSNEAGSQGRSFDNWYLAHQDEGTLRSTITNLDGYDVQIYEHVHEQEDERENSRN